MPSEPTTTGHADSAAMGALEAARQATHEAYARGAFDHAITAQRGILAEAKALSRATPGDYLFLGLMLYGGQQLREGIESLRDGIRLFPDNAPMHENLGVFLLQVGDLAGCIAECQQAVALGSDSPNVHDCLCDAWSQIGRPDEAIAAGRAALEAKDRKFGGRAPLVAVPDGLPPAFNWSTPQENVIAYCLWGSEPRYLVPLQENVRIVAAPVPRLDASGCITTRPCRSLTCWNWRDAACSCGLWCCRPDVPAHRKLLWRFEAIADPTVRRFLIRDADSLLSVKERVAVDAWLQSRFWFHTMRDWYTHTDLVLAGMWGGVGNVLPTPATLMRPIRHGGWRTTTSTRTCCPRRSGRRSAATA